MCCSIQRPWHVERQAQPRRLPFGRAILALVQTDLRSNHDNDLSVDVIIRVGPHNPRTLVEARTYAERMFHVWAVRARHDFTGVAGAARRRTGHR